MTEVALVHDYLTQRGGAERVLLSMLKAFPNAPLHTSLYLPDGTFPEFRSADVRPLQLDRISLLRRHHRLALPLLASAFSNLSVEADVALCSSSGWAHGVHAKGRKVVYCYAPARWLYQTERYVGNGHLFAGAVLRALAPQLRRWDRRAACSADQYLTQSTAVRNRIRQLYGIDAEVLPGPYRLGPDHPRVPVPGITPGFFLCVSRLLSYKNVDVVVAAFADLPSDRLVVVGSGPEWARLKRVAPANVKLVGVLRDEELAWLYWNSAGIIAASFEDYGLTPVEAAAFGKPSAVLRWGGFLDTVIDGETGLFFDSPTPSHIQEAVGRLSRHTFNAEAIRANASRYSEERFIRRLQEVVLSQAQAA